MSPFRGAIVLLAAALACEAEPTIVWDPATLVLVRAGAVYARMARLPNGEILCSYERGRKIWVSRSADEGRTWARETLAAEFAWGAAANPELLVLRNGTILLPYNERPTGGGRPYTIRLAYSRDNGVTWSGHRLLYEAGVNPGTGCWEPAAVQLPSGEIQLFFANEKPYPATTEQEISLLRSFDDGETWSEATCVSLRAGYRDGMPVPLVLAGDAGIAVAIEDNGLAGTFKPAIVFSSLEENWRQPPAGAESPRRWGALSVLPEAPIYLGAPYLRQFPSGETVLSVQSGEGRAIEKTLDRSRMVVYVGDARARNFAGRSVPFPVPEDQNGLWNSLFLKNATTVTAISGTVLGGVRGVWAIDGKLVRGADSALAPGRVNEPY